MLGAAAGAVALPATSKRTSASVERRGIQFDSAVDLVDDYGADPTGSEPVDDAVEAAAGPDTLVVVPDGTYQFDGRVLLDPGGNLGFLAERGTSPRFVPPSGHNDGLLTIYDVPEALFEGIDIDIRKDETTAGLGVSVADRFHVQDVDILGRGTHPDSDVANAFNLGVTDPEGAGLLRDVTATKGSSIDHYKAGNGRSGARVGGSTRGNVRIEHCHFEEFGNNGLYVSRTPGDVQVVGGTYRNNNVSGVRIAGEGSYVRDATVEVDPGEYTGPEPSGGAHCTRGIVVDAGNVEQTPGARIENCDVLIENDGCVGAVCVQDWASTVPQELYLQDTTITVNDDTQAVYSEGGPVHVDDVTLVNGGSDGCTVTLNGELAPESGIDFVCATGSDSRYEGIMHLVGYSDGFDLIRARDDVVVLTTGSG